MSLQVTRIGTSEVYMEIKSKQE